MSGHEYRFKIENGAPGTVPMARLAGYMADLAALLGETSHVRFLRAEESGTVLVQHADESASAKVRERLAKLKSGGAPATATKALRRLNDRLREDRATGSLTGDQGDKVLEFVGGDGIESEFCVTFRMDSTLQGRIVLVGGEGEPTPVHIRQGKTVYRCRADRTLAVELAKYLFDTPVRVSGNGRWTRGPDGIWTVHDFVIGSYRLLDPSPLSVVAERLRAIKGSEWGEMDDPWNELLKLRHGDDGGH